MLSVWCVSGRLMVLEERRRGTRLYGEGDMAGNFDGKMYVIIAGGSGTG